MRGSLLKHLLWMYPSTLPLFTIFASALAAVSHPGINFDATGGQIVLLGDFDGLSFYNTPNASAFLAPASLNTSAVYLRNQTSGETAKVLSLEGGTVTRLSPLAADSVLVEGTFSAIDGNDVTPPVIYNVTSQELTPILTSSSRKRADTVTGRVLTTFVDGDLIYLGGDFEFNGTYGAAVYSISEQTVSSMPFRGFGENSSVNAIAKYPLEGDDASIIYGGSFNSLGLPELLMHNISIPMQNSSNSTNTSLIQAEQVISLKHATFSSVNGISSNDDTALICPTQITSWALENNSGGELRVSLPLEMRGLKPTKVRLYVPANSSDGIRDFRIYSYPNNGIMNLTYVDPNTNEFAFCDAFCPLQLGSTLKDSVDQNIEEADLYFDDDSVYLDENGSFSLYLDSETKTRNVGYGRNYQEFAFVNDIMIDAIGLTTVSWYGSRGELAGLELYSDAITVYGNETLNEPNCGSESAQNSNSAVIISGDWQPVSALTDAVTNNDYLVSVVDDSSSITLYPNISYAGNYSILFYTPGCSADNSCAQRSIINVTLTDINDDLLSSNLIYQNNLENKFDYLFYGHLNGSSTNNGRNKVQIEFVEQIDTSASDPWVVVDKIVANIVELDETVISNSTNSTTNSTSHMITTMSLNGLFEYSLANFSSFSKNLVYETANNHEIIQKTNTFVGNSTINVLSGNLSETSSISNIVYSPGSRSIFLNGNLTSSNVSLSNSNLISLAVDGYNSTANDTEISSITKRFAKRDDQTIFGANFNDSVSTIENINDGVVVLGRFSMTESRGIQNLTNENSTTTTANNFALYSNDQWFSFGNAYVDSDFSEFTSLVLNDTEFYVFSSTDGTYLTWDNTKKEWSKSKDKLDINSAVTLGNSQQVIGGLSFGVMDYYGVNQGFFRNNDGFSSLDLELINGSVLTSYFLNSTFSVIGGTFGAENTTEHVTFLVNNTGVPLQEAAQWSEDTAVTSLYINTDQEFLFIGTNGSVQVRDANVTGLLVYNLKNESFSSVQPPDLSTTDGSALEVNALALYDQSSQLFVGGNFDLAGSLGCESVCLYDIENTRWISPYSGAQSMSVGGSVTDAKFVASDSILVSGNLTFNGTSSNFLVYDFSNNIFSAVGDGMNDTGVTEPISKFLLNDNANSALEARMAAIGSGFVIGYNGSGWSRIDEGIQYSDQTKLSDLALVQLSQQNSNNGDATYFDSNKALLLSGKFNLTDYGSVSAALFDGTNWIPYVFSSKDSTLGQINSLLLEELYKSQSSSDLKTKTHKLSVGQVVGVSLACALGSTALLGLLVDQRIHEDEMMDIVNPEDLIHEMDAQRNY
ncbi:hypothetical protein OY671_006109 [Metschnikowia pulcherrima]|nr:hypothetical protein OY671_006109 [Metschnikowia pulcherrima]